MMDKINLYNIAFPDTQKKEEINLLTEKNFKILYPEIYIHNTSKSRRRRLVSPNKSSQVYFDSETYKSFSNNHRNRLIQSYFNTKIYGFINKLIGFFLSNFFLDKKRLEADIDILMSSSLFDSKWYKKKYNLSLTDRDLAKFYLLEGFTLLHDPSINFSTEDYLKYNQDVLYSNKNPLLHYIKFGSLEKRRIKKIE